MRLDSDTFCTSRLSRCRRVGVADIRMTRCFADVDFDSGTYASWRCPSPRPVCRVLSSRPRSSFHRRHRRKHAAAADRLPRGSSAVLSLLCRSDLPSAEQQEVPKVLPRLELSSTFGGHSPQLSVTVEPLEDRCYKVYRSVEVGRWVVRVADRPDFATEAMPSTVAPLL